MVVLLSDVLSGTSFRVFRSHLALLYPDESDNVFISSDKQRRLLLFRRVKRNKSVFVGSSRNFTLDEGDRVYLSIEKFILFLKIVKVQYEE